MKTANYVGGGRLQLGTAPDPAMVPGGAVLKLRACGIAISDIRAYTTGRAAKLFCKLAGEFTQVSEAGEGIEVGTRVFVKADCHCGQCAPCRRGFINICEKTIPLYDNSLALSEYLALPQGFLDKGIVIPVGNHVSFEEATQVGPLSNCLNTLRTVEFKPGENVAVVGAGPMGLLHILLLKAFGAEKVLALDIDEFRLQKAKEFGADYAIDAKSPDAVAKVKELTRGGPDIVIAATGRADAMHDSIEMAGDRGRINLFGGTALEPGNPAFLLDPNKIHYRELKITGTYSSLPNDYRMAADMITSRRICTARLDTHFLDFGHIQEALTMASDPRALRVMIRL